MNTDNESTKEIWKPVKGYENKYHVSNLGRVKSIARVSEQKQLLNERILKPGYSQDGYPQVVLCKNSTRKCFKIHRLVAVAFHPNPEDKPQINHINGIKTDNRPSNLEWATASENLIHAHATGLTKQEPGEKHHMSKLTKVEVLEIRANKEGLSQQKLAEKYNVHQAQISNIVIRKRWKHI